jgi:hypothetical protein
LGQSGFIAKQSGWPMIESFSSMIEALLFGSFEKSWHNLREKFQ